METRVVPIGSFVRIEKPSLQSIVNRLRLEGYRTVGPVAREGAVVYDDLETADKLPIGLRDEQHGGTFRLVPADDETAHFDHVVGPHSLKSYVFPPRETVLESVREEGSWKIHAPRSSTEHVAVIGPRACDLHALAIEDRVFLKGDFVDTGYSARREGLFLVAVNCRRAAATCFCHSMGTGPAVRSGFDLALTELDEVFVVEVGSERGGEIIADVDWTPSTLAEVEEARAQPETLREEMARRVGQTTDDGHCAGRDLDTTGIRDLLLGNPEHPHWEKVAERCLGCANCTMVCPTCFCSTVEDLPDLGGDHVRRERSWASCFSGEHSYMNSGTVRKSIRSQYRQWLTHKLASWLDQYGVSGCVGCGRCITWCPVGIDLTEEVEAIRSGSER